ncbi:alpha-N-methyltransferase NTM1 [Pyronema domesticum]|uniref:Alpha N-terminal protein methyltransferase 1 n=1 Tax=Pyronema omphalodes (strain CBS 100304) TaxID=1076935 RepID=U4LMI0_PYROM|nr:alpha-N-methyltransferase NTM1 [Pyronema domesticum]CCX33158.1 Similar to Alpha N-terminal protein methyltransferase 1; acc. no. P38340 [Pyronema omphalodes CBS 100304]
MASTTDNKPADADIDTKKQLDYWNSVDATPNGMLGGFESISRVDIQGSKNFFAKLKLDRTEPLRVADCGAGIGRITKNFLTKINKAVVVDIVEPVKKFTDEISNPENFKEEKETGQIGQIINMGLEQWTPEQGVYWMIWNQWCVGHLTDTQLIDYLKRCATGIREDGVVVVKENISNCPDDIYDEIDSSVTRTDNKFRLLFREAGLKVIKTEVQRGLPSSLFQVRAYALRP